MKLIIIFLGVILILLATVFFSLDQKTNDNKDVSSSEKQISLTYSTSSKLNDLSNIHVDNEFGFAFDYPKEMIIEVIDEDDQNNANILKKLYIKSTPGVISDRNIMYFSVVKGDINYVFNYYDMSSHEEFSSSTITIDSMEGLKLNYRGSFSGENQNDILLNMDNSHVLHISYSTSKSNDVEKFEPNTEFDSILNSIKLVD